MNTLSLPKPHTLSIFLPPTHTLEHTHSCTLTHTYRPRQPCVGQYIRISSTHSHTHMHRINPLRSFVLVAYSQKDGCVLTHTHTQMCTHAHTHTHTHTDPDSHAWDGIRISSTHSRTHTHIINPLRRFFLVAYSQKNGCVLTHTNTRTRRPRQPCVGQNTNLLHILSHTHAYNKSPPEICFIGVFSKRWMRTNARTYTHRPRQTCVGQDINLRLNIPLEKDYPEAKLRKSVVAFVPTSPGTTGTNINRYKHKSPPPYFSA